MSRRSFNCATGACGRCVDGAALRCSCSHHRHPSQLGSWPLATVALSPENAAGLVVDAATRNRENTSPEIEDRPAGEARPVLVRGRGSP